MSYQVMTMGGKILAEADTLGDALRSARQIANARGYYVEVHGPSYRDFIYPAAA